VCELVQHVSLSADKRVNWRCYRLNATLVRPKAGSEYVAGIDNMRTVLVEPRQYDEEENEVSLDITLVAKSIDSIGYMADPTPPFVIVAKGYHSICCRVIGTVLSHQCRGV
jgi:hypothetical protein